MKKSIILSTCLSQIIFLGMIPIALELFAYLHPVVIAVIWVGITFLCFYFVFLLRKHHINVHKHTLNAIFILYTLALLVLMFNRPSDPFYGQINLTPFSTVNFYLSGRVSPLIAFYNLTANIVLFMPYGVLAKLQKLTLLKMMSLTTLVIASLEALQLLTRRGNFDIDDLILNLFGVFLGGLLFPLFNLVFKMKNT
ncbi:MULTISPECIES: VanZ family protein [unclassified Bacillus (in: firmicutes)]|uniref:VanZ family protein n=1 Tax=unclassified Bacillus (in: firmicutes) TaxID=185979 RepID=UPI0008F2383A|nr:MULTISPECIES: VanZ family protein [unclassified Bacillus (in: firmicutes)]SFA71633.1 VanZ like family protein [Bacillus sp. UNCCL13]SFQ61836.1 VanZ like family protein [Bacillus sp. cl95]